MRDPFDVSSAVVVLTGGCGRLGSEYAAGLLRRGARVAVLDLPETVRSGRPAVLEPWSADERLAFVPADVTDPRSLREALDAVVRAIGEPTSLVNNAAIDSPPGAAGASNPPFEEYPLELWREVVDVNLTGVFLACQVFGEAIARNGGGAIVNISSIYGHVSPDQRLYAYRRQRGESFTKPVAYAATKSAILNVTRYLATYWATAGVRVNTLTLGGVFAEQDPEFVAAYVERVPLGRMAAPEDYLPAVVFLVSEASRYMTGADLVIDGGWLAW